MTDIPKSRSNHPLPSKPRILHIIGSTVAGGAEQVAIGLARQFTSRGNQMSVFALSGNTDSVGELMRRRLKDARVAFNCGPVGAVGVLAVLGLAREIGRFKPDLVHVHTPNTELAHALAAFLLTVFGSRWRTARTLHGESLAKSWLYLWAYRRNKVTLSVACSSAAGDANADWATPVLVIRNGVDFSWPVQDCDEKETARRRLALDPSNRHYIMVGGMRGAHFRVAPKGHDILISAWQKISAGARNMQLHLVGDGNLRQELERLAAGDPTIRFWGVSPNVGDWLLAADIVVIPSRHEGLPLVGIEALGTGLPCIFSDIAPLRELSPAQVRWFSPGDVTALSQHLESDFQADATVSRVEAIRIRRDFGLERMVSDYANYYDQLLSV